MGYRPPKNKFEMYFTAIGELLTLGAFLGAFVFIIEYGCYKLFGWEWFKDNPILDLWIAWIIGVGIILFWSYPFKKNKDKENQ